jgi:membrane protein DedA with SNARE-associated domain/membrane-associated phospholipid phosphatase
MDAGLGTLTATIGAHAGVAYFIVFAIALAESLAVIGVLVPGVAIMLIAGALIGNGVLAFWPACLLAIAGAILGDSLSFWLGRHYKARLRCLWPFSRHPAPLARGIDFFSRHGAKSVVLGRFVGPMRAMVPLVAGMLEMPTRRFLAANIASALAWGPLYLAPGILFGASLKLAAEAATGLLFIAVALLVLLATAIWTTRRLALWASARANAWLGALLRWADLHPVMGRIAAALADPEHPDAATLTGLALALLLATLALGFGLGAVLLGPENLALNRLALDLGASLSAPSADRLLLTLAVLGDPLLLLWLVALVFVSLRLQNNHRDAGYWLAAASFALPASPLLGAAIGTARPTPGPDVAWQLPWPWSFPTPPVLGATLVYGFLALLIARTLPARGRWIPFALAISLVAGIGFARLYFGTEWLTDLLASFALGLIWLAALGLAYARHTAPARGRASTRGLLAATVLLLWLPGYVLLSLDHESQRLLRVRPQPAPRQLAAAHWLAGAPHELPRERLDLWRRNRQPFDLQYAGPLSDLSRALATGGWQPADMLDWRNAPRLLSPSAALSELPVIPHVHQGQHERLVLTRDAPPDAPPDASDASEAGARYVLRLWQTPYRVEDRGPLWIGDITRVEKDSLLGLLAIPLTRPGTQTAELAALAGVLGTGEDFAVHHNENWHAGPWRISRLPLPSPPSAAAVGEARADDPTPARP